MQEQDVAEKIKLHITHLHQVILIINLDQERNFLEQLA